MGKANLIKKTTMKTESIEDSQGAGGYIPVLYDALDEAPPDFVKPMSKAEQKRRKELEGLIYRNFKAFYDVGLLPSGDPTAPLVPRHPSHFFGLLQRALGHGPPYSLQVY